MPHGIGHDLGLFGGAEITGQHAVAVFEPALPAQALHQFGQQGRRCRFPGKTAMGGMTGQNDRRNAPRLVSEPLQGKARRRIADMAENHLGLDGQHVPRAGEANRYGQ